MTKTKIATLLLNAGLISSSLALSHLAIAQTSQEQGYEISKQAKVRDMGWGNSESKTTMILRNAHGEEAIRNIRIKSLEVQGDGDKSLTVFDKPRDVKGTAFLSFSHTLTPDDQWLYMPSLKRVKRISSRNKSGPFMGSEFSFEDLSSFELEKYTYNYLGDESCDLGQCAMVEQVPVDKTSGYTRRIVWVDTDQYRIDKISFYDRKNTLLKTLAFKDYKQYLGKYWRAHEQEMQNQQNGKTTVMQISDIKFETGLTAGDFNKNALKRAR